MVHILCGEDEFSIAGALEKIKEKACSKELRDLNTTCLDGADLSLNQLNAVCESVPFLSEKRLVIVEGLLGRFEITDKAPGKTSQQVQCQQIAECIGKVPPSTVLVLVDGIKIKDSNPLLKAIGSRAEVHAYPKKNAAELRQWILERVSIEGGNISPAGVKLLAELAGGNLRSLSNEIKKLVLFASGRAITEQDIKSVVSEAQEADVFALIDAVFDGRIGIAEQILQQLLERGVAPSHFLTMLSRQLRMIVLAKELKSQGKSSAEIKGRLGITWEFILRKVLQQVDKYSMEYLKLIYRKLLETDLAIKTGKYSDELALDLLIAELSEPGKYPAS